MMKNIPPELTENSPKNLSSFIKDEGSRCCNNCIHFSSEPLSDPCGWCGLYPSESVNTDILKVCPKFKSKIE